MRVVATVQARLISNNTPMLAVPGWRDNASEPKAVLVVSAENTTGARGGGAQEAGDAAAPVHDEVDIERDAYTQ